MSEFKNRIEAQRHILKIINASKWHEELFGLSSNAIERWVNNNCVNPQSQLVQLIKSVAEKLFFLANKSQEQITEEYQLKSAELVKIANLIKAEIDSKQYCT